MRLFQDALTVSEISFMMTSQMVAALWIGMRIFPPSPLISLGTICTATGGIFRLLYSNGIYLPGGREARKTDKPRKKNWGKMDFSCDYDNIIYFLPFDLKFTYLGIINQMSWPIRHFFRIRLISSKHEIRLGTTLICNCVMFCKQTKYIGKQINRCNS